MTDSSTQTPEWGALTTSEAQSNEKWWPNQLNLRILHQKEPDYLSQPRLNRNKKRSPRLNLGASLITL